MVILGMAGLMLWKRQRDQARRTHRLKRLHPGALEAPPTPLCEHGFDQRRQAAIVRRYVNQLMLDAQIKRFDWSGLFKAELLQGFYEGCVTQVLEQSRALLMWMRPNIMGHQVVIECCSSASRFADIQHWQADELHSMIEAPEHVWDAFSDHFWSRPQLRLPLPLRPMQKRLLQQVLHLCDVVVGDLLRSLTVHVEGFESNWRRRTRRLAPGSEPGAFWRGQSPEQFDSSMRDSMSRVHRDRNAHSISATLRNLLLTAGAFSRQVNLDAVAAYAKSWATSGFPYELALYKFAFALALLYMDTVMQVCRDHGLLSISASCT